MTISRVPLLQVMILDHMRVSAVAYDQLPEPVQHKMKDCLGFFQMVADVQKKPQYVPEIFLEREFVEDLTYLLRQKKGLDKPEFAIAVYKVGALSGSRDLTRTLVELPGITAADKLQSLKWAAARGHVEVVEILMNADGITNIGLGEALKYAAAHGQTTVVKVLMQLPQIFDEDITLALSSAIEGFHFEIVMSMMKLERLSQETKEDAFITAANRGYFKFMEAFANDSSIGKDVKIKVFLSAVRNKQFELIELFERLHIVPEATIAQASFTTAEGVSVERE